MRIIENFDPERPHCPDCGCKDVRPLGGLTSYIRERKGTMKTFRCSNCGVWTDYFVPDNLKTGTRWQVTSINLSDKN